MRRARRGRVRAKGAMYSLELGGRERKARLSKGRLLSAGFRRWSPDIAVRFGKGFAGSVRFGKGFAGRGKGRRRGGLG